MGHSLLWLVQEAILEALRACADSEGEAETDSEAEEDEVEDEGEQDTA